MSGLKKSPADPGETDPLVERDDRPPRIPRETSVDSDDATDPDIDLAWEDGDPADRRRDPLRKP